MPVPTMFGVFAASRSFSAWNPADKNSHVTLSGGNLTMASSLLNCGVRGTQSRSSGKLYYEVSVGVVSGNSNDIGIMTGATPLADGVFVGSDATGWGWANDGAAYHGSVSPVTSFGSYGAGSVVGVAVDLGAGKIWWAVANVFQNGSPSSGTGGQTFAAGSYFPANSVGNGGVMTANFGASAFSFTPPVGFSAWG